MKTKQQVSADGRLTREAMEYAQARRANIIDDIRRLVELESPSRNKQAVDRCGEYILQRFTEIGGKGKVHRQREFGNQLQIDFPADGAAKGTKPILLLGHYDTVWDVGTLATMPLREAKGRLCGPGVFDMKAGIAIAIHAISALREISRKIAATNHCAA